MTTAPTHMDVQAFLIMYTLMIEGLAAANSAGDLVAYVNYTEIVKSECILWHFERDGTCVCGNQLNGHVRCNGDCLIIKDAYCITWDSTTNTQLFTYCLVTRHKYRTKNLCHKHEVGFYALEAKISGAQLNNFTCNGVNRIGTQCSRCIEGYGPAALSDNISCADCSKHRFMWILNVLLQLAMLTVMYFIFTLLQVKGTSSPLNILLTYSQLVVNAVMHDSALYDRLIHFIGTSGTLVSLTILGVFNLDFFRLVIPPFCISSSIRNINILLFEYITVIYPIILTALVFLCLHLHDQNYKIVVCISNPIRKLFHLIHKDWNPQQSIFSTFATFFLLSYSKVLFVSINLLFAVESYDIHGQPVQNSTVMLYDPSIRFLSPQHIPYAVLAIVIVFVFVLLPPLFLLLYPLRPSVKLLTYCGFQRWDILHMIMDTFQGWYKDGTDGTRDFRPLSALYMFLRIGLAIEFLLVVYVNSHQRESLKWFIAGVVHICLGTIYLVTKPYKKQWMSNADGCILTSLGLLILMGNYREKNVYITISVLLLFPLLLIVVLLICNYLYTKCSHSTPSSFWTE